jgi:hypothetical protein
MPDGAMEFCASNKDLRRIVSVNPGLNAFARFREGEPPGEQRHLPARTEPRPPGITQGRLEAMIYMWTLMQRHFPTLLVALPRKLKSLPGALLIVAKRIQRVMTLRWMIAVAVVAVLVGSVLERRSRFLRLAEYHRSQVVGVQHVIAMRAPDRVCVELWLDHRGRTLSPQQFVEDQWHDQLASKYFGAAARPWLPVASDTPRR